MKIPSITESVSHKMIIIFDIRSSLIEEMKFTFVLIFLSFNSLFSQSYSWTQINPPLSPDEQSQGYMANLTDNQVLLFGGIGNSGNIDETWLFNGSSGSWTQLTPNTSLSVRRLGTMTSLDGDLLLFGGRPFSTWDETWKWNIASSDWVLVSPSTSPPGRERRQFQAAINENEVLLFGGNSSGFVDDTWIWNNITEEWTEVFPPTSPSARQWGGMVGIGSNEVLLFGGLDGSGINNETWVWNNPSGSWTQLSPATSPSEREQTSLVRLNDEEYLLFAGIDGSGASNETWIWNNNNRTWRQLALSMSPSARYLTNMAQLSDNKILLYGGQDGSILGDTWIFEYFPPEVEEETSFDGPNNGDGNNDGIIDLYQSEVITIPVEDNFVTIEIINGCNEINDASENFDDSDTQYFYPYGKVEFKLPCSNAEVKLYFHGANNLSSYNYRKLGSDNIWFNFDNTVYGQEIIDGITVATIILNLRDGFLEDYDGEINSIIYDPGGPAIATGTSIPIWDWSHLIIIFLVIVILLYATTKYDLLNYS